MRTVAGRGTGRKLAAEAIAESMEMDIQRILRTQGEQKMNATEHFMAFVCQLCGEKNLWNRVLQAAENTGINMGGRLAHLPRLKGIETILAVLLAFVESWPICPA